MQRFVILQLLIFISLLSFAQPSTPPGLNLIRESDLKHDVYTLAGAHFKGRSAGTEDELKAAAWLSEQYRSIGLRPAGDDSTFLQFFTLWRNQVSPHSAILINNRKLKLWDQVMVSQMANISLNDKIIYLGDAATVDTNNADVQGKVIAIVANPVGINMNVSLPTWRYNRYIYIKYGAPLVKKGAKAIIFIADSTAENAWADASENYIRGTYDITGGPNENVTATVPVLWVHKEMEQELQRSTTLQLNLMISKYSYPSVNVIGKITGTDSKLKSEYVLYSGHIDAHGIRNPVNGDSVYYGADDNASVDAAMLANARAFVKHPPRRSVIFIIHGAEERGLFGSKYYSAHPTVPIDNIVAVLNGDMIGRNNPDSAALIGALPPHRNSSSLVNMALSANKEGPGFKLDTTWDNPAHPEGWYFRSDHLPYARLGIPAIMYSSLLHPDYHTPLDRADKINYPKLKKMADWMFRTGWKVANAQNRPAKDKDFKLERWYCALNFTTAPSSPFPYSFHHHTADNKHPLKKRKD